MSTALATAIQMRDPSLKSALRSAVLSYVYGPPITHLRHRVDSLIRKNTIASGAAHDSFMYKNEFYTNDVNLPPLYKTRLQVRFYEEMNQILTEQKSLQDFEWPRVENYLRRVFNVSDHIEDYYLLLPEAVHHTFRTYLNPELHNFSQVQRAPDHIIELARFEEMEAHELLRRRIVSNLLI